jgi:predicted patatin/cPLA2 family phospholipase
MGLDQFTPAELDRCVGGIRPAAAIEGIHARRVERLEGRGNPAGRRSAVVLQGGAMRGVISAGAMIPMETLGFTEGFDAVYGASAGAINGAYFLAGQAAFGASVYYRDVANRRFINFLRPRKVMDMDFVFDEVVGGRSRVDVERIRRNPTPLLVVATDLRTGAATVFSSHDTSVDLLASLKASAAVPVLYGRSIALNGSRYVDGGVVDAVPIERAIADGCTDILVILTVPKALRARAPGLLERGVAAAGMRRLSAALAEAFVRRHEAANRALDLIAGRVAPAGRQPVNIVAAFPDPRLGIGSFTTHVPRLKRAAVDAAWRVMRLFSDAPCRPTELIQFVQGRMGFETLTRVP